MRPVILAAAFGLLALPAAAQSPTTPAAQPAAVPAPATATTAAADPAQSTVPAPRANMTKVRSGGGGYSGCSYSTAGPVS